ncbi:hypothetical protein M378DRAFT_160432, partial [Amanita muscaria Koide BX008]
MGSQHSMLESIDSDPGSEGRSECFELPDYNRRSIVGFPLFKLVRDFAYVPSSKTPSLLTVVTVVDGGCMGRSSSARL